MKRRKLIALLLTSAMVIGAVTACDNPTVDTAPTESSATSESETVTTETTEVTIDLEGYKELSVADVSDEGDDKIMIYGHNSEFIGLAEKYAGVTSNDYDFIEVTDSAEYQTKLDAVLSDGNGAPDIFTCDAAYARKYLASDNTISINDLGIDYAECTEMFDYTLRFASDENSVVKGLAWNAYPGAVFYERSLAEEYLGSSDPQVVAASFATWDNVLASAKTVNEASEGSVKLIAGTSEIYDAFLTDRTNGWVMDGSLNIDPNIEGLFDFAKQLYTDELTFRDERWSEGWSDRMSDKTVVSYWGSYDFAKYQLALNPGEGTAVNPTSGDWGVTTAPVSYYTGGSWVMASKYCDQKATAADIVRAVCINEDNLKDMVNRGEFVNSVKLMTQAAADDKFCYEWLGGQNPYPVLLDSAMNADSSLVAENEDDYSNAFKAVVGAYSEEAFETIEEAEIAFRDQLVEDGIIDH